MPVSLFVNDQDRVQIVLFMAESKTKKGFVFCDTDKESLVRLAGDEIDAGTIEQHQVEFKSPTYGDTNNILDVGIRINDSENIDISPNKIRLERICTLIKSWTFKDDKGKDVPTTRDNVKKLNPVVAITLGVALELELRERGLL